MPLTQAEIEARLTAINARLTELYATNVSSLSIAGRSATYRDIAELEQFRDKYERELSAVSGVRPVAVRFQQPEA